MYNTISAHSKYGGVDSEDVTSSKKDQESHVTSNESSQKPKSRYGASTYFSTVLIFSSVILGVRYRYLSSSPSSVTINGDGQIPLEETKPIEDANPVFHHISDEDLQDPDIIMEQMALKHDNLFAPEPFSTVDPADLGFYPFGRPEGSSPSKKMMGKLASGPNGKNIPLPTNMWYENMILLPDNQATPNNNNQVYTVPYVIDTTGPISGIRLFATRVFALTKVVQITFVGSHGLTMGLAPNLQKSDLAYEDVVSKRYSLLDEDLEDKSAEVPSLPLTPLGMTMKWEPNEANEPSVQEELSPFKMMSSSIVRGMPYGTMHYHYNMTTPHDMSSDKALPTVVSETPLASPPIIDSNYELPCSKIGGNITEARVDNSVRLFFSESDYTWLVFYSHPVYVRCYETEGRSPFMLQAVRIADPEDFLSSDDNDVFTSRIALMNNCTTGKNPTHCRYAEPYDKSEFSALLHKHAHVYPGRNTKIDYTFFSEQRNNGGSYSYLQFDWDARKNTKRKNVDTDAGILMYALPHHLDKLQPSENSPNSAVFNGTTHCDRSLNGKICIVEGHDWVMKEDLGEDPSFSAPRPPGNYAINDLAEAIRKDISFELPTYFQRGAGDTYFSGKMLAKLARIVMIAKEVMGMCDPAAGNVPEECSDATFPSETEINQAVDHLRSSTEIWINGTAETPFVYDTVWGGVVSCGCYFNGDTEHCDNIFPDCPSFYNPGLDFGHGFYNDHHFHQGYHIYAAAAVAELDPDWGKKYFEHVLLLIRDFANPSPKDEFFPTYRMKDWYLGNSWAAGISAVYPNGKNQESSSEAIASYEAVSLYGRVMADVWEKNTDDNYQNYKEKATVSRHIRDVGRLLTATELRSADTYWHVRKNGENQIYPEQYQPRVVGIMWNMMAEFQTWFGGAPYLAFGIQLMPLTPIAERRDNVHWAKELYPTFAQSCVSDPNCDEEGWGVLQNAILATVGHPHRAIKYAKSLPEDVFTSAGGNGHSLTNTIWYYSTRPETDPLLLPTPAPTPPTPSPIKISLTPAISVMPESNVTESPVVQVPGEMNCGCTKTCTTLVLDTFAGLYTCRQRIKFLTDVKGHPEHAACHRVGGVEFKDICSGCDPERCVAPAITPNNAVRHCPPCSRKICRNKTLNRCSIVDAPFLCTAGENRGGCSQIPWIVEGEGGSACSSCCQLSFGCNL